MKHQAFTHPWLYTLLASATLTGWVGSALAQETAPSTQPPAEVVVTQEAAAVAAVEETAVTGETTAVVEEEAVVAGQETPAVEDEPGAEEAATDEAATEEPADTRYTSRGYRGFDDRYREQMRARIEARRLALERYRSARRWWNNPGVEARRQWNQSRNDWYREQALSRRAYRPDYDYDYGYEYGNGPGYRYGRGYGSIPPWDRNGPWGSY